MATQVTLNSGSVDSAGSLALKTNGTTTAVTINSSQGVEFNAGTAALPAITTTGDTNTGIFFPAADTIAFSDGGAEAMRIDSSGNILAGTTVAILATAKATFSTTSSAGIVSAVNSNTNLFCVNTNNTSWEPVSFRYNTSTEVGRIACTSTATSYVTSSDYRLKESIAPMTGALAKVTQLKPVTYKWKVDGSDAEGFIAHELAEVCPQAVSGEKDAVNADGNPQYQGIDTSFLVATLTAAIQEQQAIILSLTDRITALEAK